MSSDYYRGMEACAKGEPCPADSSEEFIKGFRDQYEKEQVLTHYSEGKIEKLMCDAAMMAQEIRSGK